MLFPSSPPQKKITKWLSISSTATFSYTRLNFADSISQRSKQNKVKVEYRQNCQTLELVKSKETS